jgi:hypothetical protein
MSARLVADILSSVVDVPVSLAETRDGDALVGDALSKNAGCIYRVVSSGWSGRCVRIRLYVLQCRCLVR